MIGIKLKQILPAHTNINLKNMATRQYRMKFNEQINTEKYIMAIEKINKTLLEQ